MKDLLMIGQLAKIEAQKAAVLEVYEQFKDNATWQSRNRTGKLMLIAAELNTTHTTVAKFLEMLEIEVK